MDGNSADGCWLDNARTARTTGKCYAVCFLCEHTHPLLLFHFWLKLHAITARKRKKVAKKKMRRRKGWQHLWALQIHRRVYPPDGENDVQRTIRPKVCAISVKEGLAAFVGAADPPPGGGLQTNCLPCTTFSVI